MGDVLACHHFAEWSVEAGSEVVATLTCQVPVQMVHLSTYYS